MKKVGIITYHHVDNLGAVLQAYALQYCLWDRWKIDATIINYCGYPPNHSRRVTAGLKGLVLQGYHAWKHLLFSQFRRQFLKTSVVYDRKTIHACTEEFDGFIAGSDQIWNYECSDWDDTYFLDFVPKGKKKYSYAASIGNYSFSEQERDRISDLLTDFQMISVREESAKKILQEIAATDIEVCPDPVFLLTSENWKKIMSPRLCRQRYVFVYLIQDDVNVLHNTLKYAEEHRCKVIINKKSPEFILHGSPQDFLSWIYYADCVFTNSFHGTAFSLVFDRPLCADIQLKNGGTNSRIQFILNNVGAQQCVITDENVLGAKPNAQEKLEVIRENAYGYLEKICTDI